MRLIGMLDSPYVRRVAISLHFLEIPFTHEPVSVFRQYDAFAAVNPVVKAPTLVTDTGTALMDSSLILQYLDALAAPGLRLLPDDPDARLRTLRIEGLALAACEKTMQIVYETILRPPETRHQAWLERIRRQLREAYRLLDADIPPGDGWLAGPRPTGADVAAAVAWCFTRNKLDDGPVAADCPKLDAFAARAERLPAFRAAPYQD